MLEGVERLEGWLTVAEAAKILEVSKPGFIKIVEEQHLIPLSSFRKIGDGKPTYLVREDSVYSLKRVRDLYKRTNKDMEDVIAKLLDKE